jgi:hypothetical protein
MTMSLFPIAGLWIKRGANPFPDGRHLFDLPVPDPACSNLVLLFPNLLQDLNGWDLLQPVQNTLLVDTFQQILTVLSYQVDQGFPFPFLFRQAILVEPFPSTWLSSPTVVNTWVLGLKGQLSELEHTLFGHA